MNKLRFFFNNQCVSTNAFSDCSVFSMSPPSNFYTTMKCQKIFMLCRALRFIKLSEICQIFAWGHRSFAHCANMQDSAICVVPHPPLPCPSHILTWTESQVCNDFQCLPSISIVLKDFQWSLQDVYMILHDSSMFLSGFQKMTKFNRLQKCCNRLDLWCMVSNYFQWSLDARSKNPRFHVVPRAYCSRSWGKDNGPGPPWSSDKTIRRWALAPGALSPLAIKGGQKALQ